MQISMYQIIVPGFAILMIFYALSSYFRRKKTIKEFIIWVLFWGLLSAFAIFPQTTNIFAKITGFRDNVNVILFISIGLLFFAVLKLVIAVENLEHKIVQLIRNEALKEVGEKESGIRN